MSLWWVPAIILLALVPGGAYVGVINDVTDRKDDLAAGKRNRTIGWPAWLLGLIIAGCLAAGGLWLFTWRNERLLFAAYAAAWIIYSLYSIPPFRLKGRGIFGPLADAAGAHVLPVSIGILITFDAARRPVDHRWLLLAAMWAGCYGFRSIIWHQLADRADDERVGLYTFAVRHERVAALMVEYLIFPFELLLLAAVLLRLRLVAPVVALIAYGGFLVIRWKLRGTWVYVVRDRQPAAFAMQGYYDFALPVSLLMTSAWMHATDLLMLALHVVVFPKQFRRGITMAKRLMHGAR